ncbi:ARM repeat-containing protein [Myriangium duriaei CBS 260.36]|uniref:ARM repeat-containing protein n=1 Tax=Myriangium duriaei CBS 260.36 TaxID=1168546 RepID=A0A9P4IV03_9PEZI|nr:ARM repeat-containing protein [Myriangium duriaei CBS 260.36]
MSVLPAQVTAALEQLVQALQSPDNAIRSQAEENLNTEWVGQRPEILLMGLVEQLRNSQDVAVRSYAAVLFRRMASRTGKDPAGNSKEVFLLLQKPERDAIRAKLLEALSTETQNSVRNKIGDAVSEIARQYIEAEPSRGTQKETWGELLGALFQASQSGEAGQREAAFRIFATTPEIIEAQHEEVVLGAFAKGFKDSDTSVQLSAMDAFSSFFGSIQKKGQSKYFSLIPDILNILPPLKQAGDSEQLTKALVAMIELAEASPKMFRPLFHELVTFSITVIQDKELEDTARQNALELMATFADFAPAMCKKDPSYTSEMVTQCLSLMTDVGADDEDAAEWNASEDLDADESDQNHVAGEQTMDRLANKLGGQIVLPPTFNWLPRMISSGSWRDRHAALMAISAISEGCQELMEGELDKVLDLVVPALKDPHSRVRWAACNALGQMSTDFKGTMQNKYHQVVLPNLIPVLQSQEPRVASHAAAALVNFCEEAEKDTLDPYLDSLLNHLLGLLQSSKRFVQEQALSTIATVADSAEAKFSKYYDTLMPLLFNVLREEQDKEYRLLRAKAMECATLIALAVGKEKMGRDAEQLVQILGAVQANVVDDDDPQASYLLHCWGRMCRILGQDFVPFLPAVMPPLLTLAKAKADIQLLDDEENVAAIEQEEGWEIVPLKGKYIGIKTSTLDDKHMAIELIVVYAQNLQAAFEPYVLDIMEHVAIPGLAFFFHDPVRVASAKCVPQLLSSYKATHGLGSQQYQQLWTSTIEKVLEVLDTEPAIETLAEMYQCFYEAVEVCGKSCLTDKHMKDFVTAAATVLTEYQKRVELRMEEQKERDEGEEAPEETLFAIEDDQTLLSDMNKAFHTIFKNQGTSFLPHWELLRKFLDEFTRNQDATQRQWALCIMDDVLEFCGPDSWKYNQHIVGPLVEGMRDDVAANRQAACYGAGVAAQKGGEPWAEFANHSLQLLFQACQRPDAREGDHVFATENACASIAKILHFNSAKVNNVQEVVVHWLDTLPVVNDEEAAPFAYSFLATLIDQQNPAVMQNAARCFKYIAEALEAETLQGQTANRIVDASKRLIAAAQLDAGQLLANLTPETQRTVQAFFG